MNQPLAPRYGSGWTWAVGLGILTALLGIWVVGDFSHPLSDGNDTDQFEYVGYFFSRNLTLWPLPHLNLQNTQSFYPYGINQVFLDWGFERDYWYTICYRLLGGPGPYLQFYYLYSLVVAAVGTFLLLKPRFGIGKPFVLGLIVSVFNFYALYKFPVHMNVGIGHWTILSMVATYRLLYDALLEKPISLPYVLLWMWLHVQVLGQELAYVAGFALTFTTLAVPVLLVVLYRRFPPTGQPPFRHYVAEAGTYIQQQFGQHTWRVYFGLLMLMVSLYLYLPLTLQIALTAWQFDFSQVPELPAWSHPLRLFIPYLPGLHTFAFPYTAYLRDTFESFGQGSPGLYLVLLAAIGWWQSRRLIALWVPIGLMLVLCLLYHPVLLPTLKIFPWFSFNRHGGRASLIYPVLFGLLALPLQWPRQQTSRIVGIVVMSLMVVEWTTGYVNRLTGPVSTVSGSVLQYCAVVRQQPGAAVLDFPFCTVGGDGVGLKEGFAPITTSRTRCLPSGAFTTKAGLGNISGGCTQPRFSLFCGMAGPSSWHPAMCLRLRTGNFWIPSCKKITLQASISILIY